MSRHWLAVLCMSKVQSAGEKKGALTTSRDVCSQGGRRSAWYAGQKMKKPPPKKWPSFHNTEFLGQSYSKERIIRWLACAFLLVFRVFDFFLPTPQHLASSASALLHGFLLVHFWQTTPSASVQPFTGSPFLPRLRSTRLACRSPPSSTLFHLEPPGNFLLSFACSTLRLFRRHSSAAAFHSSISFCMHFPCFLTANSFQTSG